MKMFGTATNDELENVEDSGILISFDEMYADKRDRHKAPYIRHIFSKMKKRFPDLKEEIIEKISLRQDRLREKKEEIKQNGTDQKVSPLPFTYEKNQNAYLTLSVGMNP